MHTHEKLHRTEIQVSQWWRELEKPVIDLHVVTPALSWGLPSSSVFHLWRVTKGQVHHLNHLDPTLLGFSTVTLWEQPCNRTLFSLMLCREKRNWFAPPMLMSQDVSLWTTSIFMVHLSPSVMREAGWLASQLLQLLGSGGLSQDHEGLPSKSAWRLSLAKATEPVWRTDILGRVLHMEHIGYRNIGSFIWSETAPSHFIRILHSPIYI